MAGWKCNAVLLMGYSFGADMLPFIQNRLPAVVSSKITRLILMSPSATTNFEVHLFYGNSGENVPAEINKLSKPGMVLFGQQEKDAPDKAVHNPNLTLLKLPGDHHYNNDAAAVIQQIVSRL